MDSNINIVTILRDNITNSIKKLTTELVDFNFVVEPPSDEKLGDYASNAALQLSKILKKNPRQIAQEIVDGLDFEKAKVEKIEIAGPGFLNFFMNKEALFAIIPQIIERQDKYGYFNQHKGITYNVEFVSANPTGPLHLGHARQAAIGNSICRILKACGYDVTSEYYVNDAGNQIHNLTMSVLARYNQLYDESCEMIEDGYHGEDIIDIAKNLQKLYGKKFLGIVKSNDENYWLIRNFSVDYQLAKIKEDLEYYRTTFDVWSSETKIRDRGMVEKTIEILRDLNTLYEKDGALWFKTTDYGDDKDRVLVKSDGTYTYIAPDIAYHIDKLSRGYDYLVDIFGADHHGYISRLKAAIVACGNPQDKLEVEIVQMVRLIKNGEEFKMSKRTGNAITLRELCNEVGVDAARYFFAARASSSHLDFDMDLAISKSNENPVYYAQYAHARMHSILEQAKQKLEVKKVDVFDKLNTQSEVLLVKQLISFKEVIRDAAATLAPFKISNYIQKLAQLFHSFYAEHRVVDEENLELSYQRLELVKACKVVIKNALDLIGVSAPHSM